MPSGLVIETFGSGNIPDDPEMVNDLKTLIEKGIPVLNLSQCPGGIVAQGKYAASLPLQEIGVVDGGDMTFEAGLTKEGGLLIACHARNGNAIGKTRDATGLRVDFR